MPIGERTARAAWRPDRPSDRPQRIVTKTSSSILPEDEAFSR
jgi:hypothetical protein